MVAIERGAQRVAADSGNVRRCGVKFSERLRAENQPMHLPVVFRFHKVVDVRDSPDTHAATELDDRQEIASLIILTPR